MVPPRSGGTDPEERVVANVEAHITGTVWKIEVEVGRHRSRRATRS